MKVGIYLTNQHRLDADLVSALDEQIAQTRLARDFGWDSLLTGHHYLNEGNNMALQAVPYLARLMAESGDMAVGTGVLLLPLHNPVYVAETVASLDVICRGNFIFGIGLGYREMEFDAFRVPKGERVKRFEECLALIRRLWTEESVSHEGPTCVLHNVRMNLKPVQKPGPPVWIAANGDKAVLRAARLGDGWFINPHTNAATLERQLGLYRAELKRAGRPAPKELPLFREIFCAPTRAQAVEAAAPYLYEKYQGYARWGQGRVTPGDSFGAAFEELSQGRFILGSPEECFQQLQPFLKLGVNHLVLRNHWPGLPLSSALASMRLISKELLPLLKKA